jgi:hypothetical protein
MFFTELNPLLREIAKSPVAFAGGFVAGILHLDLNEEPLKSWLSQQGVVNIPAKGNANDDRPPQQIEIE